jgi:hypothetical protein
MTRNGLIIQRRHSYSQLPTLLLLAGAAFASGGCGPKAFPEMAAPPAGLTGVDAVVYLIGDAGRSEASATILSQLKADAAKRIETASVVVAFLGDNVYGKGLHPPSHPNHTTEVGHLERQIDVVRGTAAQGVFIPGNHDWGYEGVRGLGQMKRQEDYIIAAAKDGADVWLMPPAGCAGPETVTVGELATLIIIATDLWLRDLPPVESCKNRTTDEALSALRRVIQQESSDSRRHLIVLAHHPLRTYGPHGGYFGLKEQLFPLTSLWGPLYLPIPFVYPIYRNLGFLKQDIPNRRNTRMREQISAVFLESVRQPLVYGAGHEHTLQVFNGSRFGVAYLLVSGAGSKLSDVGKDDALFAVGRQHGERGYMRLEFFSDGRVLLSVITDGTAACVGPQRCAGRATLRYWRWLAGG